MPTCFMTTAYLAPVQYYCKLFHFKHVVIERYCNYVKQTYRNRCVIATTNGKLALSIPIEKCSGDKQLTKDVRIAEHGNWQHLHWNAIISAYNSSPFFEYYQDDFYSFFEKKYTFLFDLNEQLRMMISNLLGITQNDSHICFSTTFQSEISGDNFDFREMIHPKKNDSIDTAFSPASYYQVFESKFGFLPNLSIIDLLFNMGPESLLVLKNSIDISLN